MPHIRNQLPVIVMQKYSFKTMQGENMSLFPLYYVCLVKIQNSFRVDIAFYVHITYFIFHFRLHADRKVLAGDNEMQKKI